MLRYLNLLHTGATLQAVSLLIVFTFSLPQKCPLSGNTSARCYVFSTCYIHERHRKRSRFCLPLRFLQRRHVPWAGTPLLVDTFSQFATHESDTASGLAFACLYVFSSADMFPGREHLCSLVRFLNLLHIGASCSLASLNCDFSASLRYHSFVCSFRITHFRDKKSRLPYSK